MQGTKREGQQLPIARPLLLPFLKACKNLPDLVVVGVELHAGPPASVPAPSGPARLSTQARARVGRGDAARDGALVRVVGGRGLLGEGGARGSHGERGGGRGDGRGHRETGWEVMNDRSRVVVSVGREGRGTVLNWRPGGSAAGGLKERTEENEKRVSVVGKERTEPG